MVVKSLPATESGLPLFTPLPTTPQSNPTSKALAKEAKKITNAEKGYAADEKYLGERQNLEQKAAMFRRVGQFEVYDSYDLEDYYLLHGDGVLDR